MSKKAVLGKKKTIKFDHSFVFLLCLCFHFPKQILFFGQMPKSSSKVFFKLEIFCDALSCCVRYSNREYQDEIFKTYH